MSFVVESKWLPQANRSAKIWQPEKAHSPLQALVLWTLHRRTLSAKSTSRHSISRVSNITYGGSARVRAMAFRPFGFQKERTVRRMTSVQEELPANELCRMEAFHILSWCAGVHSSLISGPRLITFSGGLSNTQAFTPLPTCTVDLTREKPR